MKCGVIWMVKVITEPTLEPVTLTEAKLHCRVDHNTEDLLISSLITAARQYCERVQGRAYITQTLEVTMDDYPASDIVKLPRPPLQSVTSIKYTDEDGTESTMSASSYIVDDDSLPGRISLKSGYSWPSTVLQEIGGFKIRYVAGYGSAASSVPQYIKQAILLLVAHWYMNRETVMVGSVSKELEMTVHALLQVERMWST